MFKKHRKKIIFLGFIIVIVLACNFYRLWPSQIFTGSRSGRVIDGITGKPIEGAVVQFSWHVAAFMENALGPCGPNQDFEIATNKEGYYRVPSQYVKRDSIFDMDLEPESVLIYKDNYECYLIREGRSYNDPNVNLPYKKKNNLVKLYPWKEDRPHRDRIPWPLITRSSPSEPKTLMEKEIEKEEIRKDIEMEQGRIKKWQKELEDGKMDLSKSQVKKWILESQQELERLGKIAKEKGVSQ